jgi:hypothetical protein
MHRSNAASTRPRPPRPSLLVALAGLATVVGACAPSMRRAVSRRPAVVAAHGDDGCAPAELTSIVNVGRCRVQLVASDGAGAVLRSSGWIDAGARGDSFTLPARFAWVTVEVDPGCTSNLGRIRYQRRGEICERPAIALR